MARAARPTGRVDLKPRLGALLGFFARLTGKMPPDSHAWIVTHEVPAFVRFEGPLYSGRLEARLTRSPLAPAEETAPMAGHTVP